MERCIVLKQLFDLQSSTYSYLIIDDVSKKALLIDSVFEQHERDFSLIKELDLDLVACLETHCHADHVTGAWLMKHTLSSKTLASKFSGIENLDTELMVSISKRPKASMNGYFEGLRSRASL